MGILLFPSRLHGSEHRSTRQYTRIVKAWVTSIGLDPVMYGTHTLRRTKASPIYRRTKNLRAVQLLLGHTKLESTVRYLGIEVDDALEMAEQTEVRASTVMATVEARPSLSTHCCRWEAAEIGCGVWPVTNGYSLAS
ncbi:Tyrosine recombinase XerC [compost metagenome]